MEKKLIKVGDSLALTFNEKQLERRGLRKGDIVIVDINPAPEKREKIFDECLQDLADKENLERVAVIGTKKINLDLLQEIKPDEDTKDICPSDEFGENFLPPQTPADDFSEEEYMEMRNYELQIEKFEQEKQEAEEKIKFLNSEIKKLLKEEKAVKSKRYKKEKIV